MKILDYFGSCVSGGHGPLGRPLRILTCEATPLCHRLQLAGGIIMCSAPCHPPPRTTQSCGSRARSSQGQSCLGLLHVSVCWEAAFLLCCRGPRSADSPCHSRHRGPWAQVRHPWLTARLGNSVYTHSTLVCTRMANTHPLFLFLVELREKLQQSP